MQSVWYEGMHCPKCGSSTEKSKVTEFPANQWIHCRICGFVLIDFEGEEQLKDAWYSGMVCPKCKNPNNICETAKSTSYPKDEYVYCTNCDYVRVEDYMTTSNLEIPSGFTNPEAEFDALLLFINEAGKAIEKANERVKDITAAATEARLKREAQEIANKKSDALDKAMTLISNGQSDLDVTILAENIYKYLNSLDR